MRFSVSVPVLSTHSTVTAPSASTTAGWRASTWMRARRQLPMARNTAIAIGNSSGSMAMPRAMPDSTPCTQSPLRSPYHSNSSALPPSASVPNSRTTPCRLCCSGVGAGSMAASEDPMRPTCVWRPVALTSASP